MNLNCLTALDINIDAMGFECSANTSSECLSAQLLRLRKIKEQDTRRDVPH